MKYWFKIQRYRKNIPITQFSKLLTSFASSVSTIHNFRGDGNKFENCFDNERWESPLQFLPYFDYHNYSNTKDMGNSYEELKTYRHCIFSVMNF